MCLHMVFFWILNKQLPEESENVAFFRDIMLLKRHYEGSALLNAPKI